MSQQDTATEAVRKTISVEAGKERAFQVFVEQLGSWWPKEYSLLDAEQTDFILEPRVGGRWYEVGADGTEYDTGRVTAYEPPDRVVVAWHLDGAWQFDPDPEHASEFEVRFVAEGEARTRVELEHRHFERHGDGAAAVRDGVDSPNGWDTLLAAYASRMAG